MIKNWINLSNTLQYIIHFIRLLRLIITSLSNLLIGFILIYNEKNKQSKQKLKHLGLSNNFCSFFLSPGQRILNLLPDRISAGGLAASLISSLKPLFEEISGICLRKRLLSFLLCMPVRINVWKNTKYLLPKK